MQRPGGTNGFVSSRRWQVDVSRKWEEEGSAGLASPGRPEDFKLGTSGSGLHPYCPVASDFNSYNMIHYFKVSYSRRVVHPPPPSSSKTFHLPKRRPVARWPSLPPPPPPQSASCLCAFACSGCPHKQNCTIRGLSCLNLSLSIMFATAFYF